MARHIILDTVVEETLIFKMKQVQKYKAQYEGQYAYGGKMLISGDKLKNLLIEFISISQEYF